MWYSHKFKGPGLRYEIGLNIHTGDIVWGHGAYPCGQYPDLTISRSCLIHFLSQGEKVVTDNGYRGERYFIFPFSRLEPREYINKIMARHETINKRIRHFKVLSERFRHHLDRHPICFHAVLNITQLMIESGEPLYQL